MRILEVMLTATSTWDLTLGLPEPLAMILWGVGLLLLSGSLRRGREVARPQVEVVSTPSPRLLRRPLAEIAQG
jgi:hypothetical protein